jgi:hypothetical protein
MAPSLEYLVLTIAAQRIPTELKGIVAVSLGLDDDPHWS